MTDKEQNERKDIVYYDESCYVCSIEINALRKRGEACGIEFIDISSPNFDDAGDYDTEMIGRFDGKKTVGADTFRAMYEKIGFRRTVEFSRLPFIRQTFNALYWVFAHCIRPLLPKKKG